MIVCIGNTSTVFFKYILINSTYKFSIFLLIIWNLVHRDIPNNFPICISLCQNKIPKVYLED